MSPTARAVLTIALFGEVCTSCKPRPAEEANPDVPTPHVSGLISGDQNELAPLFPGKSLSDLGLDFPGTAYRILTKGELRQLKRDLARFLDIALPDSAGSFVTKGDIGDISPNSPRQIVVTFFLPRGEAHAFRELVVDKMRALGDDGGEWAHYIERTYERKATSSRGFDYPPGVFSASISGRTGNSGERENGEIRWSFHPTGEWIRYQFLSHDEA